MKENTCNINEVVFNKDVICIRSEENIKTSQEVDILVRDVKVIDRIERDLFLKGCLLDKVNFNYPHIKISDFNINGAIKKEYDLVSRLFVFDKSRWFNLVKDTKLLSYDIKLIDGKEVYSLSLYDKYITLLLHSFADKKNITFKYLEELKNYKELLKNKELEVVLYNYHISCNLFKKIEKSFFSKSKLGLTRKLFFISLSLKQPSNFFLGYKKKIFRFTKSLKKTLFKFKVVVFMGADGSGKTTTITELIKHLGDENCYYVHLGNKSQILPTTRLINRLRKKQSITEVIVNDKIEVKKKRTLILKIKEVVFNINYFLEVLTHIVWIYIKNTLFTKKKYIMVDRYIYDRYELNEKIFKYNLFPSPDIIFLLDASLETLLERKNEHSKEVLEYFQNKYYAFLLKQNFSETIRISSENNLESNLSLINKLINDEC